MKLATWLQSESWEHVYDGLTSSEMAERFHNIVKTKIEEYCPTKTIRISALNNGKPRFPAIEKLVRQKKRIYLLKGNCSKYKELKRKIKDKLKSEGKKFIDKQVDLAKEKGGSWQRHIKKMTARPGEDLNPNFVLPSHLEQGLTTQESAERINAFFQFYQSRISTSGN